MVVKNHTEKEIIERHQQNVFLLDRTLKKGSFSIKDMFDEIPSYVYISKRSNFETIYLNKRLENFLEISTKKAISMGWKFQSGILHPELIEETVQKVKQFSNQCDDDQVLTYYIMAKKCPNSNYCWYIANKKVFCQNPELFLSIFTPVEDLVHFSHNIKNIFDENCFAKRYFKRFQNLTRREKEILKYVALGHTQGQISELLFISKDTIKKHCQHIYKKLETKKIADLIKYSQAFNLMDNKYS